MNRYDIDNIFVVLIEYIQFLVLKTNILVDL